MSCQQEQSWSILLRNFCELFHILLVIFWLFREGVHSNVKLNFEPYKLDERWYVLTLYELMPENCSKVFCLLHFPMVFVLKLTVPEAWLDSQGKSLLNPVFKFICVVNWFKDAAVAPTYCC